MTPYPPFPGTPKLLMKVGGELVILGTDGPLPQQSFEGQGRTAGWQKGGLGFRV